MVEELEAIESSLVGGITMKAFLGVVILEILRDTAIMDGRAMVLKESEEVIRYLQEHEWHPQNTEVPTDERLTIKSETVVVPSSAVRFEAVYIEE